MFLIRRIYDEVLPINRDTLEQVKTIMRRQFPGVDESDVEQLGQKLNNPFKQRFRTILFVAETSRRRVLGFAILMHDPQIGFCYLDWIATATSKVSGGIGGALYERVRQEALALGSRGLFFECLPDDSNLCAGKDLLLKNRARLRFYERYGAVPIINTAYETPVNPEDTCSPCLVYDSLGRYPKLERALARKAVRAVLERKYAGVCPQDYVEKVVRSFRDDPVHLRALAYVKPAAVKTTVANNFREAAALVVNDRHDIHHIREQGYVESPVRIRSILSGLEKSGLFQRLAPIEFPERHITAVHDADFVHYIRRACREVPENKSLYPYVFPIRNRARPPKERSVLAGYYCIDTFTPLNRHAYPAARHGVDCCLTAARQIIGGRRLAYALVRPPGHHAERRSFGGFCYLNNNAIAAHYLSRDGRVAILDIDYHHGNGQQDIFYRRSDVLTVSIHGHPQFAYPYFTGFREEVGEGEGEGYNLNLLLPENTDAARYRRSLAEALGRIEAYAPEFLVVALGLDTAKGDPTGTWSLNAKDFEANGRLIGELGLPTLVIQEGGYRTRTLGTNVRRFFAGLTSKLFAALPRLPRRLSVNDLATRTELMPGDPDRIRRLVQATKFFSVAETEIAGELAEERLARGEASGYHFLIAESKGRLAAYACYGEIPMTASSYDLYWIAVDPEFQARGLGRMMLSETEKRIRDAGGTRVYVETSLRTQYETTRTFYEKNGYRLESVLEDFYAPGDGKGIYSKSLSGS